MVRLMISLIVLISVISSSCAMYPRKPSKMVRDAKQSPKEMSKEESEKHKAEREEVKKLMAEYNRKKKAESDKRAEELEKDEKLKEVLREIEAGRAKHPEEQRKPTNSISEINANVSDGLYEGDIELSLDQAHYLINLINNDTNLTATAEQNAYDGTQIVPTKVRASRRRKRGGAMNVATFPNNKWPIYVPFSFDGTISSQMKSTIYAAVQLWYDNTCLYLTENASASPRIQFTSVAGKGCKSSLGKQASSTYQNVYLESSRCDQIGIISHEIGHALGFYHEQSRYDRDTFVWYNSGNVNPNETFNFDLQTAQTDDNYQVAYDLGSDMHYSAKAFSLNNTFTLVPKAGAQYINTIGKRYGPSLNDYLVMNRHYCGLTLYADGSSQNTVTCSSAKTCANAGFQNPNACSYCICPPGYTGSQCQNVDTTGYAPTGVTNTCNGTVVHATSDWQDLYGSIGTSSLDSNVDFAYCHWQIVADVGKTISIQVLEVGNVCSDACFWGNTEIRTDANRGATGMRICCDSDLGSTGQLQITAPNGYAMISLYSFYHVQSFHIRFMQS